MTHPTSPYARLAALARCCGLTHADISRRIGCHRPEVSAFLAGRRVPSPLIASRLCDLERALAVQAAEVLAAPESARQEAAARG